RLASRLAGLLAGSRRLPTTILRVAPEAASRRKRSPRRVEALARATAEAAQRDPEPDVAPAPVEITTRPRAFADEQAVAEEAKKGYDLLVIGVEPLADESMFSEQVARIAEQF